MFSQLTCIPAATTKTSWEIVSPEEVVTEEVLGENVATFSARRVICRGTSEERGRRNALELLSFRPPPTSVHPGYWESKMSV